MKFLHIAPDGLLGEFIIRIKFANNKINQKKLFEYLKINNIESNLHYFPIHLQPFFIKKGFKKNFFPNSEKYSFSSLSIPIFYSLDLKKQNIIIKIIRNFFQGSKT